MEELKILLVEDHLLTRETIVLLAEKNQFQIVGETSDSKEALGLIKDESPHVVILDLVLPKQDVLALILKIKKEFPNIPLIACSSLSEEHIMSQVLEAGCFDYILKPFEEERFVESIRRAVA